MRSQSFSACLPIGGPRSLNSSATLVRVPCFSTAMRNARSGSDFKDLVMTGSKDHPYIVVKPFPAGQRQADLYKTSMPDTTTLGRRLYFARVELRLQRGLPKLSQEALGKMIGVGKMSISDWEKDKYAPSRAYQKPLADALGVPVGWLMHAEGLPERIGNVTLHSLDSRGGLRAGCRSVRGGKRF